MIVSQLVEKLMQLNPDTELLLLNEHANWFSEAAFHIGTHKDGAKQVLVVTESDSKPVRANYKWRQL